MGYFGLNTNEYGNFGMSTILIKTAFSGGDGITNKNFQNFRNNRLIVAKRLAARSGNSPTKFDENGFPEGFNENHQSVLRLHFSQPILEEIQIKYLSTPEKYHHPIGF